MLPTMTPSPSRRASSAIASAFGEPAAFVELDVDDVETADERRHVGEAEHAFVGGDRDRRVEAVEIGLAAARAAAARAARRSARRSAGDQRVEGSMP